MAPIKLEENIREKLQERELQPSSDAWSKLESQLETEDEGSKSKNKLWFAIAASIATLLIVGALVFSPSNQKTSDVVVEDTNTKEQQYNDEVFKENTIVQENNVAEKGIEKEESNNEVLKPNDIPRKSPKSISEEKKVTTQQAVASTETKAIETSTENIKTKETPSFIDTKVTEVVAQVKNSETITAEEVDVLLLKAQREIQAERILNESKTKIDATALLQDVEGELERSFRDKVFEALGENFNSIRTAVIERNN
ncbi:hypothetical protein [Patiriisocius hiemis]|uniref:Uncharacterized protein n=1 Tax=Patiriisocius hiemis TaxID=3075604 RepID=A0ABU2YC56_9FLAO|nr:hypothetical protein [Constantimarinum sp. W242]MDT0555774.1 hypothetical protein [Constantimarinum sp. W242]